MSRINEIEDAISEAKVLIRDELVGAVEGSGKIVIQWKCGRCRNDGLVVVSETISIQRAATLIGIDHDTAYPICEGLG
jgi:hypothetical protein